MPLPLPGEQYRVAPWFHSDLTRDAAVALLTGIRNNTSGSSHIILETHDLTTKNNNNNNTFSLFHAESLRQAARSVCCAAVVNRRTAIALTRASGQRCLSGVCVSIRASYFFYNFYCRTALLATVCCVGGRCRRRRPHHRRSPPPPPSPLAPSSALVGRSRTNRQRIRRWRRCSSRCRCDTGSCRRRS